jgi:transcriptional regulator with XRE-family HTH domain
VPPRTGVDPSLAYVLRKLRDQKGLGQEGLAHAAGLSVAAYTRIERGKSNPTWTSIRRIVAALDVPLSELAAELEAYEDG